MPQFDFASASQILFGKEKLNQVGPAVAKLGKKALIAAGYKGKELEQLTGLLEASGASWETFMGSGEPTIEMIQSVVKQASEASCDVLIGFGGGSALDTAKAAAAMLTNPGDLLDYLEVVGRNQTLKVPPLPFVAIPTTAGTGSEVTRNAVISVPEKKVKVSLRSPMMLAKLAIIDPLLTIGLPPAVTASTGMDALAQVIEPYVSNRANAFIDLFCKEGIQRGSASLLRAYQTGADVEARENMAFTSLMGGLALANAGLGAVHGFAGPLGGMFDAPHGAVCACLLPPVVIVNSRALAEREPENPALARYAEIARLVTGSEKAAVADLGHWLDELRVALGIPDLRQFGVRAEHLDDLVEKGAVASSMKANPLVLQKAELREILEMAL
jgi:alcohol dehydrogenase class IV